MRLPRQSRGVSFLFLNFGICSARQTPPVLPCRTAVKTETLKRSLFGIYETDYVKNRFYRGVGRAFLVLWYTDAAAFGVVFCHGARLPHRHDKSLYFLTAQLAHRREGYSQKALLYGHGRRRRGGRLPAARRTEAGIDLHIELFCGLLVTVWLIINELISVLENLAAIGVPGFPRLNRLLSRLKSTVNEKEDEHDA